MAVSYPTTFLVSIWLLKLMLLVLTSSSCITAWVAPFAPDDIDANGRRDHVFSADHASSSVSMDDSAEHGALQASHRLYSKSDTPGIRFDMMRRASSCEGSTMLQGADSRSRHFVCALARGAHKLRPAEKKTKKEEHLSIITRDTAHVSTQASSDWKFPESVGIGDFLVSINLGTPPVKANVIIDTSNDLTWIQSQPCNHCFTQVDPIFNPSKSSTYKQIACSSPICGELLSDKQCSSGSCRYVNTYGVDSDTEGFLSTETMTVGLTTGGNAKVALVPFGASRTTTGWMTHNNEEEGVLGLGQGAISLPSQLGKKFGNKFSYCLVHWLSNETSSLYFGAAATPKGKVQYTPIVPNSQFPTYYYIRVLGISVGATLLPIDQSVFEIDPSSGRGGTILDTGFTAGWFLPKAYDQIIAAYKSQVKYPISKGSMTALELCFDTAGVEKPSFPTMEIHLDGAHLRLPTPNTFISVEENISCLAIYPNKDANRMQASILGVVQQQEYDIVYDLKNKKIGFAPADCATV